jgi:hypothetical protein
MKRPLALALVVALALPSPASAVLGVADTGDGILSSILVQNIQETLNTTTQLAQLREMLANARESYEFMRSTYAVSQELSNFNADDFLRQSREKFLAANPEIGQARSLANDISRNGIRGGTPNLWALQSTIDLYRESTRAEDCCCGPDGNPPHGARTECQFVCPSALQRGWPYGQPFPACAPPRRPPSTDPFSFLPPPRPYDKAAAERLSLALNEAMSDEEIRKDLLSSSVTPSVTDAIIFNELAQDDPAAAQALLRERAAATYAGDEARKQRKAASGTLNVGEASLVTARSSSLAAEQLAAMREAQARQLALQEQSASREAQAQRKEEDATRIRILRMGEIIYVATRSLSGLAPSSGSSSSSLDPYSP